MGKSRRCVVPNCRYLQKSKDPGKRVMFRTPKNEEKARLWAAAIPGLNQPLTPHKAVCEKHFESKFIQRYPESGATRVRSRLNKKAVPTIFDTENEPYLNAAALNRSKEQSYGKTSKVAHKLSRLSGNFISALSDNSSGEQTISKKTSIKNIVNDLLLSEKLLMNIKQEMFSEDGDKQEYFEAGVKNEAELTAYEHLHKNFSYYITQLPENWNLTRLQLGADQVFAFSKECTVSENDALIIMNEKSVVINKNGDVHFSIHGKMSNINSTYTPKVISDIDTLLDVISKYDDLKVCQGICTSEFEVDKNLIVYKDDLGISRHDDCTLIADKQQCDACWEYSQYLLALMVNNTPVLAVERSEMHANVPVSCTQNEFWNKDK